MGAYGSMVLLAAAAIATANASDESAWDNLKQLQPGHKVQIVRMDLKNVRGRFHSLSEAAIVVRANDGEVTVPKRDVYRVTSLEQGRRGRNALLGTAVGALAGAGIGAILDARRNAEHGEEHLLTIAVMTWGGAAGAIGGALSPGHPTLYRAPKPPKER